MNFKCSYSKIEDVDSLIPNPKNRNVHKKKQIEVLSKIIKTQGQRSPIVVSSRTGFIVKGHGRLEAIKLLGWKTCAVDVQDYKSEAEEYQDMIADNEIARYAEFDKENFLIDVQEIEEIDFEDFGLIDFVPLVIDDVKIDDEEKKESKEKFIIQVEFENDMERDDIFDDLLSKGYLVKKI